MDVSGLPLCARVDRTQRMAPGERVRLRVPPQAVHLFDASGRRLAS